MGGLPITVESPSERLVAVGVLSHGLHPDSRSINKVTKFLVKGSYWNRFELSSQTSFRAFLQTKLSHPDFELLYNNWIKDSVISFRALEQEPGIADADFPSMGTTTALKNIIGGGVCKFDGSSSACTQRKGIVCS